MSMRRAAQCIRFVTMEIPLPIRELMVQLRAEGQSIRKIAETVKKPPSSVQYVLSKYRQTKSVDNRCRSGRPAKLETRHKRAVLRYIRQNPKMSAPKLAAMLERDYGINVVAQTIRNIIKTAGYNGRVSRKKPYVSKVNRQKRLAFAKEHVNKPQSFWDSVIFSDESIFRIFGSGGRVMVWRRPNQQLQSQNLTPTVKHGGGGVCVWGCMSATGVGNLVFVEGNMDWRQYMDILKQNLHASAEKLNLRESFIFQQDNDPKHTALNVKLWLLYNTRRQLHTPPQSPDMNPIEHLWGELKRRLTARDIRNKAQLKVALLEEWNKIEPETTRKLVTAMRKRMRDIIKAKGGPTDH